ncbi:hypothetical protein [Rubrolithibacter danxiaensis]|uniref:hypothetical protein n=1 Tax=Rubrolithibacter danxiaensis TaxID=3390805 RepID=UPI003BF8E5A1
MSKGFAKKIFCSIFLFIFFAKMVIAIAPFVLENFDQKCIYSVIMQLEIENEKGSDGAKEKIGKELCNTSNFSYSFFPPLLVLFKPASILEDFNHRRSFYPSIPTPPPNA